MRSAHTIPRDPRPTVELKLMQRADKSQYFEVWVRSEVKPGLRQGTIVDRNFQAETRIEIAAGAIAEQLCEQYHDTLDPGEVARAARKAFLELEHENPRPQLGNEAPIEKGPKSTKEWL